MPIEIESPVGRWVFQSGHFTSPPSGSQHGGFTLPGCFFRFVLMTSAWGERREGCRRSMHGWVACSACNACLARPSPCGLFQKAPSCFLSRSLFSCSVRRFARCSRSLTRPTRARSEHGVWIGAALESGQLSQSPPFVHAKRPSPGPGRAKRPGQARAVPGYTPA